MRDCYPVIRKCWFVETRQTNPTICLSSEVFSVQFVLCLAISLTILHQVLPLKVLFGPFSPWLSLFCSFTAEGHYLCVARFSTLLNQWFHHVCLPASPSGCEQFITASLSYMKQLFIYIEVENQNFNCLTFTAKEFYLLHGLPKFMWNYLEHIYVDYTVKCPTIMHFFAFNIFSCFLFSSFSLIKHLLLLCFSPPLSPLSF